MAFLPTRSRASSCRLRPPIVKVILAVLLHETWRSSRATVDWTVNRSQKRREEETGGEGGSLTLTVSVRFQMREATKEGKLR